MFISSREKFKLLKLWPKTVNGPSMLAGVHPLIEQEKQKHLIFNIVTVRRPGISFRVRGVDIIDFRLSAALARTREIEISPVIHTRHADIERQFSRKL